ncbi:MAG: hypothetical protein ACRDNW_28490, partial [Trebonia sp.]
MRDSRKTQVAVAASASLVVVAAAVAGITLADQHVQSVNQAAFGACLSSGSPQASGAPDVGASGGASAAPCQSAAPASASATASSGRRVSVAPGSFANGPIATRQLGDVARRPVDGQGNKLSFNQTAKQAANSGTCTLVVPPNPLSARGLATP